MTYKVTSCSILIDPAGFLTIVTSNRLITFLCRISGHHIGPKDPYHDFLTIDSAAVTHIFVESSPAVQMQYWQYSAMLSMQAWENAPLDQ